MCFQICVIIELFGKRVSVMGKINAIETHVKIFSFVLESDSLVQNCNLCKPVYGIKTIHFNTHRKAIRYDPAILLHSVRVSDFVNVILYR